MRLWYLSHRRPAKAQASLCIRAVSPEHSLFAHMKYGNKIQKLSSFKSNENIHKREDGSYYVVSANKASSVTL